MKRTLLIGLILLILPTIIFGQKISYNLKLSYNLPYIAEIKETPNINPTLPTTGYTSYTANYSLKESLTKIINTVCKNFVDNLSSLKSDFKQVK